MKPKFIDPSPGGIARVPAGPPALLPFVGHRTGAQVANLAIKMGIEGASHQNGRTRNAELIEKKLAEVHREAGDRAVAEFLARYR